MCELLAISSQLPTHAGFSLEKLTSHSQHAKDDKFSNRDGWGVAYYEGRDVTLLREPQPASESKLVQFIEQNIPPTQLLISHIRQATKGDLTLKNTHPFMRELGGCMHVFAHNGDAQSIQGTPNFTINRFQPIGDTDSEYAFCSLLDKLVPLWEKNKGEVPLLKQRFEIVSEFAKNLKNLGPANFLYADSDVLFAHADKRTQDDGEIKPPGLYKLMRQCNSETEHELEMNGLKLSQAHEMKSESLQQVAILASVPLTDEEWQPIGEGEVLVFSEGKQLII